MPVDSRLPSLSGMDNSGNAADSPASLEPAGLRPRRTVADWGWLAVLAMGVLAAGFVVGVIGPLFAIACDTCQDGVRNPRFVKVLITLAWYVVPATTLGTVVGIFLPRGGARAGVIGLGALMVLLIAMVFIGRVA